MNYYLSKHHGLLTTLLSVVAISGCVLPQLNGETQNQPGSSEQYHEDQNPEVNQTPQDPNNRQDKVEEDLRNSDSRLERGAREDLEEFEKAKALVTLPDLVPEIFMDGDILTVKVSNQGSASITSTIVGFTYIYINDMSNAQWTYSWSTLADTNFYNAGASSLLQSQTLTGYNVVKACVDSTNVVAEQDESNNCTQITIATLDSIPDSSGDALQEGEVLLVANERAGGGGQALSLVLTDGSAIEYSNNFAGPSGLVIHPDTGVLYVSDDQTNDNIFSEMSTAVFSSSDYGLSNPNGLDFDDEGRLLIADAGHQIVRVDLTDNSVVVLATGFANPQAVVNYGDDIYFTDFTGHVFRITPSSPVPVTPGTVEMLTEEIAPQTEGGLTVDSSGNIYLADYAGHVLRVLTDGTVETLFEVSVNGDQFQTRGLRFNSDESVLFVTGYSSNTILEYHVADGSLFSLASPATTGDSLAGPFGMVILDDGIIDDL